MSKVYLYSNIVLVIISIVALILSILDIIVKESGQQQDGCPASNCIIDAQFINAKRANFNRIIPKSANSTVTINVLSNLSLNNVRITNIISDNTNINEIENNVNLSNNSLTIGDNKVLNFKSLSIFSSDIGTSNLSSLNISCTNAYITNLFNTSITASNTVGNNLKTTNTSFQDIKGDFVKSLNASFTNISFQNYSTTNIILNNPSISKLICTNCTVSNISSLFNISVSNIFYKFLQCTNMNTKGTLISATTISFSNLLNKSFIQSENFTTENMNGLNDLYFDKLNPSINCSNVVGLSNFSFSNVILSTNNVINNLYKFGNFTNSVVDSYINNLTCTNLITNDTIFINNLPLNNNYTNLESNNIKYSLNIQKVINTPLTRPVNGTSNNSKVQIDITPTKKINMKYISYNSSTDYDFSSCLYIYPSDGYFREQPNSIEISFSNSSNLEDVNLLLGTNIRCIFDTIFKAPLSPYVLKIFNKMQDYNIEIISNKNIYDNSTKFTQNILLNGDPGVINIFKGENNLDFMISILITCTNVDIINKKVVFLILPI